MSKVEFSKGSGGFSVAPPKTTSFAMYALVKNAKVDKTELYFKSEIGRLTEGMGLVYARTEKRHKYKSIYTTVTVIFEPE